MAIGDLYTALLGGIDEADYVAKDPFFLGGANLLKTQYQPRTNLEALLGPLAQGLASGTLMGFGRDRAAEAQYDDLRNSTAIQSTLANRMGDIDLQKMMGPVSDASTYQNIIENPLSKIKVNDYLSESRPEGWSPNLGKADAARAVINLQSALESKQKAEELRQALELKYSPAALEGEGAIEEEKARRKLIGEGASPELKDVPAVIVSDISKSKGVVDEARVLAKKLDSSGLSWGDLQTRKAFSGADKSGIALELKNLADRLARARTGAAINANEQKLYDDLVGGDLTASPKQVANLLRKLAEAEGRISISTLETAASMRKGVQGVRDAFANTEPSLDTKPKYKASELIAQGYKQTAQGWVKE